MILPIGHDHNSVRRRPVATYALMALCVGAHLFVISQTRDVSNDAWNKAFRFYLNHLELEAPEELLEELEMRRGPEFRRQIESMSRTRKMAEQRMQGVFVDSGDEDWESDDEGWEDDSDWEDDEADYDGREALQTRLDRLVDDWLDDPDPYRPPLQRWGLIPSHASLSSSVTYMFVHAGWLHLVGNLLFLFLSGPFLEDRWGRPLFVLFYLSAGMISGGLFAVSYPDLSIPLVGASGAIAGLLGAFLVRFPRAKLRFWYFLGIWGFGTFEASAMVMLPLWFLRELGFGYLTESLVQSGVGGVAYWVHIWGFGLGALVAGAVHLLKLEEKWIEPRLESMRKPAQSDNEALDRAMEARFDGKERKAFEILARAVEEQPDCPELLAEYWDVSVAMARPTDAAEAMKRLVLHTLQQRKWRQALELWERLCEAVPSTRLTPALATGLIDAQIRVGQRDVAKQGLERIVSGSLTGVPSESLLDLARQSAVLNSPSLSRVVVEALSRPGFNVQQRNRLERLLDRATEQKVPKPPGRTATAPGRGEGDPVQ